MSFNGKVYTVTGGASGIGQALCVMLVKAGASVYASDVNEAGLKETAALFTLPTIVSDK